MIKSVIEWNDEHMRTYTMSNDEVDTFGPEMPPVQLQGMVFTSVGPQGEMVGPSFLVPPEFFPRLRAMGIKIEVKNG